MTLPALETRRLALRPIEEGDAPGLHGAYGDAEAMRFWDAPATRDVTETAAHIRNSLAVERRWHGMWAIVARSGGFAGMINYHNVDPRNRRLALGWILAPAFWHQGLMTEAAEAVLSYCFSVMEMHRVEALIEPENVASRGLAAKLGFKQESDLLRDRLCVAGQYRSVLMYALLQADWADSRSNA
ncbi:MAG: GNAT family N-acetyltransferase [Reyranella sp.]|uniref:GNAT family N-acetyltransferase n=1 Tax=Reyranella sp. TaxID=1929291 RepID=UPI00272FF45D|nr:GNAT family N-acetyltransferase [Reyranella sp.]MDP1965684.1 GNAT family N-acetyltransferase [Reyranella sp.]MDP2373484.1 GNAT family N-acetyltransferase [Reyranella sp.]